MILINYRVNLKGHTGKEIKLFEKKGTDLFNFGTPQVSTPQGGINTLKNRV